MSKKSPVTRRGASTDTVPGKKPSVAHLNEIASKNNLDLKVKILLNYVSELESGVLKMPNLKMPTSARKFYLWEYEDPRFGKVARNGRLTFLKYEDVVSSASELLDQVSKLHRKSCDAPLPIENLAAARRSGALQKVMRQICERELIKMRALVGKLNNELEVAKAQYASLQSKSREMLDELSADVVLLQKKNQDLIKQNNKVIGIGVKK